MFNNITNKFISIIKNISGYGRITEQKLHDSLRDIRIALLEADVSLSVIEKIISKIKTSIIGKNINLHLTPGQEFIQILKKELISIMTVNNCQLKFKKNKPDIFLIIGIQGSGKTSTVSKLSHFISTQYKKNVLVSSTDIYRPAAITQLKILSKKAKINFFQSKNKNNPIEISIQAIKEAKKKFYDVLILDTAGRLHTDKKMMQEIYEIQKITNPVEILFVIDAMMGQDTINIAKEFNKVLHISGLILTKIDSDTRGGSALSASYITKQPIKFISTGEKITSFSIFKPERIVSKILGMGDILSIIETIDHQVNKKNKIKYINKNHIFNLNDFKKQIKKIKYFGGINQLILNIPKNILNGNLQNNQNNENIIKIITSIIDSMTPYERLNPKIIKNSRKKRIAKGSGNTIQNVNQVLKQFFELKNMMKKIKNNKNTNFFQRIQNILPNTF